MRPISRSVTRSSVFALLSAAAVYGCDSSRPVAPEGVAAKSSNNRAGLAGTALIVGNLNFGPTDGILRYDGSGDFLDVMVPIGTAGLRGPCCMTFGPDQHLYVSSPATSRVLRFHGITGAFIDEFIPPGSGGLLRPLILVFHGGFLYVGDFGDHAIRRYNATTGAFVDLFIPPGSQGMAESDPQHFVFGPDGKLYVASEATDRVLRYDGATGSFVDEFVPASLRFDGLNGLVFSPDGKLYVTSGDLNEVRRFDIRTGVGETFVAAGSGGLRNPVGLTFGPDGHLYVASAGTSEILRYDGDTGAFLGAFVAAGAGGLTGPRTLTFRPTVTLCHRPPGNTAKGKTLTIGYLSGSDHVAHGDPLGRCE